MKEKKLSIAVKALAIVLACILILASIGVGVYFVNKDKVSEVKTTETVTKNKQEDIAQDKSPSLTLTTIKESGVLLAAGNASSMAKTGLTKTLTATVVPSTAKNKLVDWSIVWADDSVTLKISDYVTVTPDSDGSTTATVTCLKPFTGNVIVVVTTRESGYTAECLVTYVGIPTDLSVRSSNVTITNNSCALGVGKTYSFNVAPTNPLGSVGNDYKNLAVTLDAVGSVVLGNYTTFTGSAPEWSDDHTVTVQSLIDNFITLSYSDGVATVTTKKTIESYYEKLTRMDGGRTKLYTNKYHSSVGDCYFRLTVTEPNSHVTKTIKITFDSTIVTGVNTSSSQINF